METNGYYKRIVSSLLGQTPDLKELGQRVDWGGSGAVLQMYYETSGKDRDNFISAIGRVIEEEESPPVVAQVLHIASSLNLTQVEPSVHVLESKSVASVPLVHEAIFNFLAYENLFSRGRGR
ncbi:MAG TPA: hypothetical protein VN937_01175 [Blastocatellia bacterium]|nr:hypothetical protein [Blastocatellia bacterium]